MWESLKMGFYQTFILEDNYQYFVKGLGTTLTVTIFALIIGVIIGCDWWQSSVLHMTSSRRERKDCLLKISLMESGKDVS